MNKDLFLKAAPILNQIQENGFEAYYIGGSVRDYLMNRPIHDIDITTSASPDEIEAIFDHTIPIGKEHGTINVVYQNENYEVTTYRAEGEYKDHRRPDEVFFVRDLYQDVERRDFTMNAIAMDTDFTIRDYFGGYEDIKQKRIVTVGPAEERFTEDALRILRGLRFKSQLGFEIETNTYKAMKQRMADTAYLSIERIIVELTKLLAGKHVAQVYPLLLELHFFDYVPFFKDYQMDHIHIDEPISLELLLAIMMYKQPNTNGALADLKISNEMKKTVKMYDMLFDKLETLSEKKALRLLVYDYGLPVLSYILTMHETLNKNHISTGHPLIVNQTSIKAIYNDLVISKRSDIAINGKIILETLNRKGGPWLKDVLRNIECAIINHELQNEQSEIIKWVKANV
ncbi:CCA tRNA nucleotidyltransferase [Staphylococcus simulans]|uniref:CCA tRNA nucleotidyltransferase n=1 Tax=Staphylococcus simulans TaxID=1286 RepID=UPI00399B6207